MSSNEIVIEAGQVWEDRDPRLKRRRITITSVDRAGSPPRVYYKGVVNTSSAVSKFTKRFRLVEDAEFGIAEKETTR